MWAASGFAHFLFANTCKPPLARRRGEPSNSLTKWLAGSCAPAAASLAELTLTAAATATMDADPSPQWSRRHAPPIYVVNDNARALGFALPARLDNEYVI